MSFWFRYSMMILLCVATPLGLGFWLDTQSQLERVRAAGEANATAAGPALTAQLTLDAHRRVGEALQLAQAVGDEKLLELAKGQIKPEAAARIRQLLESAPSTDGGFVWVIDETGVVVSRFGAARDTDPAAITGHPLFVATQLGLGIDGTLRLGDAMFVAGGAPIARDGEARGAVILARPIDASLVTALSSAIRTEVTVIQRDDVVASTLPTDIAANVVSTLDLGTSGPTHGGRLAVPLKGSSIAGFLPLFVPHDLDGLAYSSIAHAMLGRDDIRWVISVENGRSLVNLAERQQSILGIFVAALLAALTIGLSLSRTFVRPIAQLTDHLSGLQQGRGERELSESQVSRPFRRLTKLVNMTVQRIPPGGAFAYGDPVDRRPSADPASADLGAAMLSAPPQDHAPGVPPSFTGASPLDAGALSSAARGPSGTARPAERAPSEPLPAAGLSAPPAPAPALAQAPLRAPSFTPTRAAETSGADAAADLLGALGAPESLDHALAAAARAVEPPPDPAVSRKPRSASSIRGAPSAGVSQSMLDMNTAAFQAITGSRSEPPRPPERSPFGHQEASSPFGGLLDEARSPSGAFNIPNAVTSGSRMGGSAAFGLGSAGVPEEYDAHSDDFKSEATVVAAPNDYLLQASARDMTASGFGLGHAPERTLVAEVPKNLLAESKKASSDLDDPEDMAHFKETYERFVSMRRQCGEPTADLVFERFVAKLRKNRDGLISKYNCRTVRFQVYEKEGKAALKATPVRA